MLLHPLLKASEMVPEGISFSLAEWSLHRALEKGTLDHLDFPATSRNDFGIAAVEYVNGFFGGRKMDFREAGKNANYLKQMVKLEPKSEMPDAQSFMAQTSVAAAVSPQAAQQNDMTANAAPMSEAQSNWQTVSATDASLTGSLKGMTH